MKRLAPFAVKSILLTIAALALITSISFNGNAQKKSSYGNVWISDFDSAGALLSVAGDGLGQVQPNLYKDYHLVNGDPCVSAFGSPGFLMYPSSDGCTTTQRYFRLYFPVEVTNDPDFPKPCEITFDATRGQYYANAWRMYFPNLFGSTSRKTLVVKTEVRYGFYCSGTAYSVQTDQQLTPIIDSTNNTRRLNNTGTTAVKSSLFKPGDGTFVRLNIDSFTFTFDVTAQLTTQ